MSDAVHDVLHHAEVQLGHLGGDGIHGVDGPDDDRPVEGTLAVDDAGGLDVGHYGEVLPDLALQAVLGEFLTEDGVGFPNGLQTVTGDRSKAADAKSRTRERLTVYQIFRNTKLQTGAADLIFRLALAAKPRTALVTAPTFAEYATALETADCTVKRHFLREENDFAVTKDLLNAVHPGTNMVFLCQPNNPTGQLAEPALVEELLRRCEAVGAVLAVDECFLDFLPEGEGLSAKHLLKNSKKLIILKAFTKLYGMAGVRLGYCLCSDTELLARMRAAGQPWAVSSLAQAAGIAALDETEYVAKVRALIEAQRPVLADGLRALGLRVIEGRANYLLFRAPEALGEALRRKGAVLRSCGNYPGLDASWYRTAVRTENENRQLLALLAETLPEVAQ